MTGNPAPNVGVKGLDQNSDVFCRAGDTKFPALVNQLGPDRRGAGFLLVSHAARSSLQKAKSVSKNKPGGSIRSTF